MMSNPPDASRHGRPDTSSPGRIIAHRGASRIAPENTLSAFRMAAEQGALFAAALTIVVVMLLQWALRLSVGW
jgi:hypothetical protein